MTNIDKSKKILLVEGPTDMHVILALCQYYNVPETFEIKVCDGIDNLLPELDLRLSNPSTKISIGITIDADNDIDKRFHQIIEIINRRLAIDISSALNEDGVVIPSANEEVYPNIGVWLMPDNLNLGMVEDFALSLIPENDELLAEAENELQKIEGMGLNRYSTIHHSKAKIHTYLSWQEDPGSPVGLSLTKKVLDPEHEVARRYVDWLNRLFSL